MNIFSSLELLPTDSILGLNLAYAADGRDDKINLGVGVYKTSDLTPYILPVVKKAEEKLLHTEKSKDYLPIGGSLQFHEILKTLAFGPYKNIPISATQTVGCTAALSIGAAFLKDNKIDRVFYPHPTWDNHRRIFTQAGFASFSYPYFDWTHRSLDFDRMIDAIAKMPKKSCLLLQACCHNPTGVDLTKEQWNEVLKLTLSNEIFPFFDLSYQGFGEGLEEDAYPVRLFASAGEEFAVAFSCSKNFGLYSERVGGLLIACKKHEQAQAVSSHINVKVRAIYSTPPSHGVRIVETIYQDPSLYKSWIKELALMRERISEMRHSFVAALNKGGTLNWEFLAKQKGMFSYTALDKSKVERLTKEFGIYLTNEGRVNIAGLNSININYVADAFAKVLK